MTLLSEYQNGNLTTKIYDDGTRIRTSEDDEFHPAFAENVDVHISNRCDNGCEMCYANCTPNGEFGKLFGWNFLNSLHKGTEMALNLNFPMHPEFIYFLRELKVKGIIANVTVNQNHFMKYQETIKALCEEGLIHGLGVSLTFPTKEFVEAVRPYSNAVIHVINGLFTEKAYDILKKNGLKILILGYKNLGRGVDYNKSHFTYLTDNMNWLYDNLPEVVRGFNVTSFDNLALEQLQVKRLFKSDKAWDTFYSGDDGTFTFFINLVEGYFAKNSLSEVHYPIGDLTMDEMFKIIVENN